MTRKLSNWLQSYMEYASYSEAPRYMHFWTGVSTIAACLQRKVWIDQYYFKWYPNFYIIIVAPPGIVAKSTTSGIGYKLLKEIEEVNIGADIVTWQSIVEAFQQAETTFYFDGQEHTMCAISYNSEELGNLIDLKDKGLVNLLIKLWDGSDIKKTTRHKGDNEITNSWINLIGCTTPAWINENMTENIIQGGLTSRCLFLYADEKEKVVSYPGLLDRSKAEQQRNDLIYDLKEINKLVGSFTMTPEAIDWGIKWYNNHIANLDTVAREKYGGYATRKQSHIHKLAMVLSVAERDDLIITKEDLKVSLTMVEDLEKDMMQTFSGVGRKHNSYYTEKLLIFIQQRGVVTYAEAYQYIHRHFTGFSGYENILTGLIKAEYIKMYNRKGIQYLEATGKKLS